MTEDHGSCGLAPPSRGASAGGRTPPAAAVAVGRVIAAQTAEALDRLRRAGIPAYLPADPAPAALIYVDEPDLADARSVLATLGDAVQPPDAGEIGDEPRGSAPPEPGGRDDSPDPDDEPPPGDVLLADRPADEDAPPDPLGDDGPRAALSDEAVDERFSALIGEFGERDERGDAGGPGGDGADDEPGAPMLRSAADAADRVSERLGDPPDPPELRDEHFERPAPPPVPRPSAAGILAVGILLTGVAILAFGRLIGLGPDQALAVGVIVILAGALLLAQRLKRHRDDTDDGAVL